MLWVNGIHEPRISRLALFVKGTACQIQYPISTAMKNAFINNCILYLWMRFWCTDRHQKSAIVDFIFVTRKIGKKRASFLFYELCQVVLSLGYVWIALSASLVFALACVNYKWDALFRLSSVLHLVRFHRHFDIPRWIKWHSFVFFRV